MRVRTRRDPGVQRHRIRMLVLQAGHCDYCIDMNVPNWLHRLSPRAMGGRQIVYEVGKNRYAAKKDGKNQIVLSCLSTETGLAAQWI